MTFFVIVLLNHYSILLSRDVNIKLLIFYEICRAAAFMSTTYRSKESLIVEFSWALLLKSALN